MEPQTTQPIDVQLPQPDVSAQVFHDIEHGLHERTTEPNTRARKLEDLAKRGGVVVWRTLKRHSYAGVFGFAALGVGIASLVGGTELALGAACGYAAYRVLKRGESARQAVEEVVREIEHV